MSRGKIWSLVRLPDLNILNYIWVSPDSLSGYPPQTKYRSNTLFAGIYPVALDYYASKNIPYPLGGSYEDEHNPDSYSGLINHFSLLHLN